VARVWEKKNESPFVAAVNGGGGKRKKATNGPVTRDTEARFGRPITERFWYSQQTGPVNLILKAQNCLIFEAAFLRCFIPRNLKTFRERI
jgi:hypothetical protein